ncbi:hypothetical protein MMC19_001193 [Ptychographa xylographoides]|nr:hypothetical protein [Ptychographa xylographoides]
MSYEGSPDTVVPEPVLPADDASSPAAKKRKRDIAPVDEIEVDISAPEPPSKKALRKAKKGKPLKSTPAPKLVTADSASDTEDVPIAGEITSAGKSEYGIWIGNLPWVVSKVDLTRFLTNHSDIDDVDITRIHMPAPSQTTVNASRQKIKPQNKGFAYVDFASQASLDAALSLSESLLSGRAVLIKNAKSFEGRPDPSKEGDQGEKTGLQAGKPPSKRIFVGNLAFDTTREELLEHFARCGEVADAFVATFEDSGKCKGYAWVTFEDVAGATKAVRGWVDMKDTEHESESEEEGKDGEEDPEEEKMVAKEAKKPKKIRKWWVNRIRGRALRMEFAEDKAVRYKKRYGKGGTARKDVAAGRDVDAMVVDNADGPPEPVTLTDGASKPNYVRKNRTAFSGRSERQVDARTIKPGAALANAERLTGAIVEGKGKKTTFE